MTELHKLLHDYFSESLALLEQVLNDDGVEESERRWLAQDAEISLRESYYECRARLFPKGRH